MTDVKLSANFWLSEFICSETAVRRGIENSPGAGAFINMHQYLVPGLQRIRALLNHPIQITSGYRSVALNTAIGGSPSSQHTKGLAADFVAPGFGSPRSICETIAGNDELIGFDQLIFEGQWVHVSFSNAPRGEVLTAHFSDGRVSYAKGLQ